MNCRYCRAACRELVSYRNIPARSQHFPDRPAADGITLNVVECTGCGLVQLANDPVPYYREVIRAVGVSAEMAELRKKQFADFARRHDLAGRKVLEVGTGRGDYLRLIRDAGMAAYGTEFGDHGDAENVEKIYFETGEERHPAGPFDAFFLLNWLEHIPDPAPFLAGIRNNLAPGAVGLVEVPNFDMIRENDLFAEFTIDHLAYFSTTSLRSALETHGFDVLSVREEFHRYILSCEVRVRPPLDPQGFLRAERRLRESIEDFFTRGAADGDCAVWGAGHQSLLMLALVPEMARRSVCVIDSAPFKQGKFTPATGLPIRPPESLRGGKVRTVLVIAGGYSDEIAGILRRDFPEIRHIGILREREVEDVSRTR